MLYRKVAGKLRLYGKATENVMERLGEVIQAVTGRLRKVTER